MKVTSTFNPSYRRRDFEAGICRRRQQVSVQCRVPWLQCRGLKK